MKFSEFRKKYGEGTDFDLDWGKLVIPLYLHCSTGVRCLVEKILGPGEVMSDDGMNLKFCITCIFLWWITSVSIN